jgi:hypothetical protein
MEAGILGFIDNSHTAAAELFNYAIMQDGLAVDAKLWGVMLGVPNLVVNRSDQS